MSEANRSEARQLEELHRSFFREVQGVSHAIAPDDGMNDGNLEHYKRVGLSAFECVKRALLAAGKPPGDVQRILDYACGHGRVLRVLRAAFPDAALSAADVVREGVTFCAEAFGATPVLIDAAFGRHSFADPFDVIWCGSLLTHLDAARCEETLELFHSLLDDGGILVCSVHGAGIPTRIRRGWNYGLPKELLLRLVRDYAAEGFGYVDYPGVQGFGISLAKPGWTIERLQRFEDLRLLYYSERAWDGHHDVFACIKQPDVVPPGPFAAELAGIDFDAQGRAPRQSPT